MTPDEMERTIQFVVSQQAQFVSGLQGMRQEADRRHGHLMEGIVGLTSVVGHLARHMTQLTERVDRLAESHEALAQAQQETEARLQTLMDVVDKYFRDRNNGRPH
jgi:two-component sensor histidine kinase